MATIWWCIQAYDGIVADLFHYAQAVLGTHCDAVSIDSHRDGGGIDLGWAGASHKHVRLHGVDVPQLDKLSSSSPIRQTRATASLTALVAASVTFWPCWSTPPSHLDCDTLPSHRQFPSVMGHMIPNGACGGKSERVARSRCVASSPYSQNIQPNSESPVDRGFLYFRAENIDRLISRVLFRTILYLYPKEYWKGIWSSFCNLGICLSWPCQRGSTTTRKRLMNICRSKIRYYARNPARAVSLRTTIGVDRSP